jgi:hypothetical protein
VTYAARVADDGDPLRRYIQAAVRCHIPPTIFMRKRTVESPWWTDDDTALVMALEDYERGLCPGCRNPLAETTRLEHSDAYRPEPPVRCHYCTAEAHISEANAEKEHTAGLLFPITLAEDVVAVNRLPIPPLPPELAAAQNT